MNGRPPAHGEQRVLITGAFGFVGRWLMAELLGSHEELRIVAWRMHPESAAHLQSRVTTATVDLTDRNAVFAAVEEAAPTAVIHLAAVSAPGEANRDPRKAWEVNLFGTLHLAEAVLAHAPEARFVHVSTSDVYGGSFLDASGPLDETALLHPLNTYALTKSAADLAVGKLASEGLRAIRMRPFNHTGPGQSETFVVAALAGQIARIEQGLSPPVLYVGNTEVSRDLLDVRDVVRAYAAAALLPPEIGCDVVNIASGRSYGIGALAERMCRLARVDLRIEVDPQRIRPNDLPKTQGDSALARRVLGWAPAIDIDRTLEDVLAYWRERITTPAAEQSS